MRPRLAAAAVGIIFGVTLCWSGMSNPDVIRQALLFERAYLFLFFASAVAVATLGTATIRRLRRRAVLADAPLVFSRERPTRRHIIGSLIFGVGWGVADACPGPIATQVGQAMPWAACTLAGLALGIALFLRAGRTETEPPSDVPAGVGTASHPPAPAPVPSGVR
ncbi:MAG TPA: DUF6691 family protein [Solirubrobacterales bacterium]|nr:DUF6691 family protein [Solirubrobacterales bacterium]